jgi:CO/xanthine dehydrogenase Mo-binding subunit
MEVVMSQIAAEELGLPMEAIGIKSADTAVTPYDRGTFSSRVTFYAGMAVKKPPKMRRSSCSIWLRK